MLGIRNCRFAAGSDPHPKKDLETGKIQEMKTLSWCGVGPSLVQYTVLKGNLAIARPLLLYENKHRSSSYLLPSLSTSLRICHQIPALQKTTTSSTPL